MTKNIFNIYNHNQLVVRFRRATYNYFQNLLGHRGFRISLISDPVRVLAII